MANPRRLFSGLSVLGLSLLLLTGCVMPVENGTAHHVIPGQNRANRTSIGVSPFRKFMSVPRQKDHDD